MVFRPIANSFSKFTNFKHFKVNLVCLAVTVYFLGLRFFTLLFIGLVLQLYFIKLQLAKLRLIRRLQAIQQQLAIPVIILEFPRFVNPVVFLMFAVIIVIKFQKDHSVCLYLHQPTTTIAYVYIDIFFYFTKKKMNVFIFIF